MHVGRVHVVPRPLGGVEGTRQVVVPGAVACLPGWGVGWQLHTHAGHHDRLELLQVLIDYLLKNNRI